MPPTPLTQTSIESMLANQDGSGAFIASPDFSQYDYCWLRDASFVAVSLDRVGEHDASARYHRWVHRAIGTAGIGPLIDDAIESRLRGKALSPSELPPARFSLDGAREADGDWPNFQLDGYGTWLWSLEAHLRASGNTELLHELGTTIQRTASYLSAFALEPCFDVWEENPGELHTSTLASVYAGLIAAESLLADPAFGQRAATVRAEIDRRAQQLGHFAKSSKQDAVDGSLLWLGPIFRIFDLDDPHMVATVKEIERTLILDGGVRRYAADTYFGGGAWPILTCCLGWYYAGSGDLDAANRCLAWTLDRLDEHGRLGEQFGGEVRDPRHYREWTERWGHPARDLLWSHAMCVLLVSEIEATSQSQARAAGLHEDKGKERGNEGTESLEAALFPSDDQ